WPVVPPDLRSVADLGQHRRVPLPLRPGQAARAVGRGVDSMNEAPDPLEAALSALRPHAVSPGLRRRIAERLADSSPQKRRPRRRIALAGGLASACLGAVLFRW